MITYDKNNNTTTKGTYVYLDGETETAALANSGLRFSNNSVNTIRLGQGCVGVYKGLRIHRIRVYKEIASATEIAASAEAITKMTLEEVNESGLTAGSLDVNGWKITEGSAVKFESHEGTKDLSGKTIEVVASATAGDYAVLYNGQDTDNSTTDNLQRPFTMNSSTLFNGSGNLAIVGTCGNGAQTQLLTLAGSSFSTFSGNLFIANNWNRPCVTTISGTAFKNAVYNFCTMYNGTNPTPGTKIDSDVLKLSGATTLAGLATTRATDSVVSNDTTIQTLTLNIADTADYTFAGTFGSTATPLSLVKRGNGAQTIGATAALQDLTIEAGSLTLGGTTSISGAIAFKAAETPQLTVNNSLTVGVSATLEITDESVTDVSTLDLSTKSYQLFGGEGAMTGTVYLPCTLNGTEVTNAFVELDGTISWPTEAFDLSDCSGLPKTIDAFTDGALVLAGEAPSHAVVVLKTKTQGVVLNAVPGGTWSVSETVDEDGYYLHTLIPTATEAPTPLKSLVFEGNLTGVSFDNSEDNMTYGVGLPGFGKAAKIHTDAGVEKGTPYTSNSSFATSGSWTISFLIKPTSDTPNKGVIWSSGVASTYVSLLWFKETNATTGTFALMRPSNVDKANATIASDAITPDRWYIVTVVYDAALDRAYLNVDGAEKLADSVTSMPLASEFQIGNVYGNVPDESGWTQAVNTWVDNYKFWKEALTVAQIESLYADIKNRYYVNAMENADALTLTQFGTGTTKTLEALTAEDGDALISVASGVTQKATLTATPAVGVKIYGEGTFEVPEGTTAYAIPTVELKEDTATFALHRSQAEVVGTRTGTVGTFKFIGGTQSSPLLMTFPSGTDVDVGKIYVAANSWVRLHQPDSGSSSGNKVYKLLGEGKTSCVYLTSAKGWGMTYASSSVDNVKLIIPTKIPGTETNNSNFWLGAGITGGGTYLEIGANRTVNRDTAKSGSIIHLADLTGDGTVVLQTNDSVAIVAAGDASVLDNANKVKFNNGTGTLRFVAKAGLGETPTLTVNRWNGNDGRTTPQIVIGDGTNPVIVAFTGANGDYSNTITVNANATLKGAGETGRPIPFGKGTIVNNGSVVVETPILNTDTPQIPAMSGTGDLTVNKDARMAGALTISGTLTVAEDVALTLDHYKTDSAEDFAGQQPGINGPSVTLKRGASIKPVFANSTLTIAEDKVLTLEDGAIIDASGVSLLTVAGSVALPETGTVNIVLPEDAEEGEAVLTFSPALTTAWSDADLAKLAVADSAGKAFIMNDELNKIILKVILSIAAPNTGVSGDITKWTSTTALEQAAKDAGMTGSITVSGETAGASISKAEDIDDALQLFEGDGLIQKKDNENTLVVGYNFGITGMEVIREDGVPTKVKVTVAAETLPVSVPTTQDDGTTAEPTPQPLTMKVAPRLYSGKGENKTLIDAAGTLNADKSYSFVLTLTQATAAELSVQLSTPASSTGSDTTL